MSKTSRTDSTIEKYKKLLYKFCKATGKTLDEIITTCIDEQNIVTTVKMPPDENGNERRREIKFDVNSKDASIKLYFDQFEKYCKKRKNKNTTINGEVNLLRTFLKDSGVLLPKPHRLEDDTSEWFLPSKEDFNFLLQDASLVQSALINFLTSTGMRVGDAVSLTISDFMKATEQYHDYVDAEDFIDNAPDDMIGQWEFEPSKTRKHKVKCITFNSTHASNLILQNLRHIKNQYFPTKNKRDNLNLTISKKDPLFGSRTNKYKKPLNAKSVADHWWKKNKKFRQWKITQIKQKIEQGELSSEDFDEEVEKIPKFHPHVCRKFFITTVSNHCGDVRVSALFEGHSDGLPNDKSYIKKSVEDIREIYINDIHDALSLDNVETKIISDKETERLNAEIESLKAENAKIREEKDQEISNLEQKHQNEIDELKSSVGNMQKQMDNLTAVRNRSNIEKAIYDYFNANFKEYILNQEEDVSIGRKKCSILCKLAYEFAIENESNFREDDKYLNSLIQKAIVKYTLNPEIELFDKKELTPDEAEFVTKRLALQFELFELIKSNDTLWNMVKDDEVTLNNIISYIIKKNLDNIDNLTDDDKDDVVQEVLMEYLTVD